MLDRLRRAILVPPAPPPGLAGGLPFGDLYPDGPAAVGLRPRRAGTRRSFAGTGASQLLAAANAERTELTVYNGSGVTLYIAHGPVAAASSYTIALADGGTYIIEEPDAYQGDLAGLWASGTIAVTEQSRGQ